MNRYPVWKYVVIVIAMLVGALYTLPNFFGESPAVQISSAKPAFKVDTNTLARVEAALKAAGIAADVLTRFKKPWCPSRPTPVMWWRSTCCRARRPG